MRKILYIFIALFMFISLAACEEVTPTPVLKDIIDTAVEAGDFDLLAQALTTADLVQALKAEGPFTVFAPNDQAFLNLIAELSVDLEGLLALPNLADILLYHVLEGEFLAADVIAQAPFEATTLNGATVMITVVDGDVYVNDAKVVSADVMANNGVIHVINQVLMPPQDLTPPLLFGLGDVVVNIGDEFDPMEGVTAIDDVDGNITAQVQVTGDYDLEVAGIYELTYTVSDVAGNVTSETRTLIVRVKPESELFITNGDFSEPLDGTWTHWAGEGGASTVQIVDGVLQYNITANGSQWWSSQFSQPNLTIPQGQSFKLIFEARADIARGMVIKLEDATYFGYVDEAVMISTEWVTYEFEFFVTRPTITNGKLIFGGGTMASRGLPEGNAFTTIYIDNVRFVELEVGEDIEAPVVHGLIDASIQVGDTFDFLQGVTVSDNMDFTLTVEDIVITEAFNNMVPGDYEITYTLTDASGNVGVYTRIITVLEGLVPSTIVLVNPDFEIDQLTPYPQPAMEGWGWHPHTSGGRFDARIENGMAIFNIHELGVQTFGVQFYQQNLIVTQGQIYKVTFDARADIGRPIQVALEQGTTRRFDEIVDITTEWNTYTVYIDHILPGYTNGKFAFFLGQIGLTSVPTTVYLDNIVIETVEQIVDQNPPVLRGVTDYMIVQGTPFNPLRGVSVFDQVDKSLTIDHIIIDGEVNIDEVGIYELTYSIVDASGNEAQYKRFIHVVEAAGMLESTLVLVNADFEIDQFTPYSQPAMLGWGWHGGGSFTVTIENGVMTQVVTNVGTVPHGTQFYQQNLIVETQAMYQITFDAKADDARAIRLSLEQGTTLRDFQIIQISEEWATYTAYIMVPAAGFRNAKFAFFGGLVEPDSPPTTWYLDNIEITLVGLPVDNNAPIIIGLGDTEHPQGVPFEPFLGLQVFDLIDKFLTVNDIVVEGEIDTDIPGDYVLVYTLTDRQGNVFEKEITVTVYESEGYVLPTNFVIFNGDFEVDQSASAAAGTGWGWHGSGQWNIEIVDGVAVIDVFETWTRFFGVQFYHLNREVTSGHTYRISFRAKADHERPIQLNLEPTGPGFISYFNVTTEWQEFVYEYKNEGNTFTNGKFSFFFGNLPGYSGPTTFYLDDVKVERILEKSEDTTAPLLFGVHDMYYAQGMPFNPISGIIVYDHYDKGLSIDDVVVEGMVDTDVLGNHDLVYTITDIAGNTATYTRIITVVEQTELIAPRFEFLDYDFSNNPVITNQDGNLGWTLKTSGTGAFTSEIVDDVLGITVINNGTVPHGIQFFQRNAFRSEAGSTYLITFRVRADQARDIHVILEETTVFRNLTRHVVEVTEEWVEYQLVLQNTYKSHADVKIGFFLGLSDALAPERSALTTIYFDFVTVDLIGYVKDDQPPRIFAPDVTITEGATFNPLTAIKYGDFAKFPTILVTSETEGLITFNAATNTYTVDTTVAGVYVLIYTLVDPYGNETVHMRTLTIVEPIE